MCKCHLFHSLFSFERQGEQYLIFLYEIRKKTASSSNMPLLSFSPLSLSLLYTWLLLHCWSSAQIWKWWLGKQCLNLTKNPIANFRALWGLQVGYYSLQGKRKQLILQLKFTYNTNIEGTAQDDTTRYTVKGILFSSLLSVACSDGRHACVRAEWVTTEKGSLWHESLQLSLCLCLITGKYKQTPPYSASLTFMDTAVPTNTMVCSGFRESDTGGIFGSWKNSQGTGGDFLIQPTKDKGEEMLPCPSTVFSFSFTCTNL